MHHILSNVNTNNFFPFKGAGWYDADLVLYACECKINEKKIYYYNINQAIF